MLKTIGIEGCVQDWTLQTLPFLFTKWVSHIVKKCESNRCNSIATLYCETMLLGQIVLRKLYPVPGLFNSQCARIQVG